MIFQGRYTHGSTHDIEALVCPYCADRDNSAWELFGGQEHGIEQTCRSCGKVFRAEVIIHATYFGCPEVTE